MRRTTAKPKSSMELVSRQRWELVLQKFHETGGVPSADLADVMTGIYKTIYCNEPFERSIGLKGSKKNNPCHLQMVRSAVLALAGDTPAGRDPLKLGHARGLVALGKLNRHAGCRAGRPLHLGELNAAENYACAVIIAGNAGKIPSLRKLRDLRLSVPPLVGRKTPQVVDDFSNRIGVYDSSERDRDDESNDRPKRVAAEKTAATGRGAAR